MDELTIGDKTYVSSKKAAKITGYAKDYVGQLCREGRVEARLVGRNWYVLESSLMEHRFGEDAEAQSEKPEDVVSESLSDTEPEDTEVTVPEEVEWQAPVYSREEPVMVPLAPKEPAIQESQQVVSDMQTAWQEWFTTQKRAQESVPESVEAAVLETPAIALEEEYLVPITHMETPEVLPDSFQPEEAVALTIHRENTASPETSEAQGDFIDLSQPRAAVQERSLERSGKSGGGRALQAVLIVVAGISFCVALIGTGAVGTLVKSTGVTSGPQKALVEYLGGESSYKSISK